MPSMPRGIQPFCPEHPGDFRALDLSFDLRALHLSFDLRALDLSFSNMEAIPVMLANVLLHDDA